jgi:HEAT repeat protein
MPKAEAISKTECLLLLLALAHILLMLCPLPGLAQMDEDGQKLVAAAGRGDIPAMKDLLRKTSKNAQHEALIVAARQKKIEVVMVLLNILTSSSIPAANLALIDAVEMAGHYDNRLMIVEALLDWGADPNGERIANDITPLMMAADHGNIGLVKLLLDNCADVSARDADRKTARDWADKHTSLAMGSGDRSERKTYEKIKELLDGSGCIPAPRRLSIPAGLPDEIRIEMERLVSPDPAERMSAIGSLWKRGPAAAPAVPFLIGNLCGGNELGRAASDALAEIGSQAVGPLIQASSDRRSCVRRMAVEALRKIDDPRVEEALLGALKDRNALVKWTAAGYFMPKASDRAVPFLIETLKDEYLNVRRCAIFALANRKDPLVVDALISRLREELDFVIQDQIVSTLYQITVDDRTTIAMLIRALKEKSKWVRRGAIAALQNTDDPLIVDPLIEALRDESMDISEQASRKLGKMKDPRAIGPLIQALEKAHERDRRVIAEALTAITGENLGEDPVKWRDWWEKKNKRYGGQAVSLGLQRH